MAGPPSWILLLATLVGITEWSIGIVLMASPFGKRIKHYGQALMRESFEPIVFVVIVTAIATLLVSLSGQIDGYLTGILTMQQGLDKQMLDLQSCNVKLVQGAGLAAFVFAYLANAVKCISTGFWCWNLITGLYEGAKVGSTVAEQLASVLGNVSTIYGSVSLVNHLLVGFMQVIASSWVVLADIGTLLYILPFKLFRRTGKFLIAFPIAGYIFIPFYLEVAKLMDQWLTARGLNEQVIQQIMSCALGSGWITTGNFYQSAPVYTALAHLIVPAMYFGFVSWATAGIGAAQVFQKIASQGGLGQQLKIGSGAIGSIGGSIMSGGKIVGAMAASETSAVVLQVKLKDTQKNLEKEKAYLEEREIVFFGLKEQLSHLGYLVHGAEGMAIPLGPTPAMTAEEAWKKTDTQLKNTTLLLTQVYAAQSELSHLMVGQRKRAPARSSLKKYNQLSTDSSTLIKEIDEAQLSLEPVQEYYSTRLNEAMSTDALYHTPELPAHQDISAHRGRTLTNAETRLSVLRRSMGTPFPHYNQPFTKWGKKPNFTNKNARDKTAAAIRTLVIAETYYNTMKKAPNPPAFSVAHKQFDEEMERAEKAWSEARKIGVKEFTHLDSPIPISDTTFDLTYMPGGWSADESRMPEKRTRRTGHYISAIPISYEDMDYDILKEPIPSARTTRDEYETAIKDLEQEFNNLKNETKISPSNAAAFTNPIAKEYAEEAITAYKDITPLFTELKLTSDEKRFSELHQLIKGHINVTRTAWNKALKKEGRAPPFTDTETAPSEEPIHDEYQPEYLMGGMTPDDEVKLAEKELNELKKTIPLEPPSFTKEGASHDAAWAIYNLNMATQTLQDMRGLITDPKRFAEKDKSMALSLYTAKNHWDKALRKEGKTPETFAPNTLTEEDQQWTIEHPETEEGVHLPELENAVAGIGKNVETRKPQAPRGKAGETEQAPQVMHKGKKMKSRQKSSAFSTPEEQVKGRRLTTPDDETAMEQAIKNQLDTMADADRTLDQTLSETNLSEDQKQDITQRIGTKIKQHQRVTPEELAMYYEAGGEL